MARTLDRSDVIPRSPFASLRAGSTTRNLQFWKVSHGTTAASATISTLVHAALIALWVDATLPSVGQEAPSTSQRVWYFPPPNPKPARMASPEALQYVHLAPEGSGAGFEVALIGPVRTTAASQPSQEEGNTGRDLVTADADTGTEGADSVFTIIEVDSAATRLAESAAPQYPRDLLRRGIEGQVIVQFVVDTTGFADVSSFRVVLATHMDFARSIREALPEMRFASARIGAMKVRQLVELPFNFRVARPLEPVAVKARPPQ